MRTSVYWWLAREAAAVLALSAALVPSAALAHERREIGKYLLVVGFNAEPAIQGEANGAQLTVTVPAEGDRAVEGLQETVKVSVAAGGGQPRELSLRAVFRQPGRYVADFIPTRPGAYVFTFAGSVEGMALTERFESGPGRFDEVKSAEALQLPEPLPPVNEVARMARAASDRAATAEAAAEAARGLAMVALATGGLGVLVALAAIGLLVARRPAQIAAGRR